MEASDRIYSILEEAKKLAQEFRLLTGKPLGVTGEIAEFEAARLLGVQLSPARQAGYDAIEEVGGVERRLQIKARCILKPGAPSGRLGAISIEKEFDAVLLVLLDNELNATAIFEAERAAVIDAIMKPGSRARNERRSLAINQFKAISNLRWPAPA
jgi:hypothetical protein